MARKPVHEEHENSERWLLTYADLITLLLAFFIVMYSMSQVDSKKFGAVSTALHQILSGGGLMMRGQTGTAVAHTEASVPTASQDLKIMLKELETSLNASGLQSRVRVGHDARGVILSLGETVLFESGHAELAPGAQAVLDSLSHVLAQYPNEIRVEGHTDNVPIHSLQYGSNWELSTNRATAVVRYLIESHDLPPYQLSAAGYAEFRPSAPNDNPEHRARNRRVDFVILRSVPEPVDGEKTGEAHGG